MSMIQFPRERSKVKHSAWHGVQEQSMVYLLVQQIIVVSLVLTHSRSLSLFPHFALIFHLENYKS